MTSDQNEPNRRLSSEQMHFVEQVKIRMAADREAVVAMMGRLHEKQRSAWEHLAPNDFPAMLRSPAEALHRLDHPSVRVRQVAIDMLSSHWKQYADSDFTKRCEMIALAKNEEGERNSAILALGRCFRGKDDVRISALLARIIRNEVESHIIRQAAYTALIDVRMPTKAVTFDATGNINNLDWQFVAESLNESR